MSGMYAGTYIMVIISIITVLYLYILVHTIFIPVNIMKITGEIKGLN